MTLADRLKTARTNAGLTQSELAAMTNVTQQQISKLESGKSTETSAIVDLADATNVNPSWLSSERGAMTTHEQPPATPHQINDPHPSTAYTNPAITSLIKAINASAASGALNPALAVAIRQMIIALPDNTQTD